MTSTISLNKNFFSILMETIKRNKIWLILTFIISGIVSTGIAGSNGIFTYDNSYLVNGEKSDITVDLIYEYSTFFSFFITFMVFLSVISLFKNIYSKRASDFVFSSPVTRKTTYLVNFCYEAILAFVGIATSVAALFLWFFVIYENDFIKIDVGYFLKSIIVLYVVMLAIISVIILCATSSGRKWQCILLSFILLIVGSFGLENITVYPRQNIAGFDSQIMKLISLLSPLNAIPLIYSGSIRFRYTILEMAIIIFTCLIIGMYLFDRRKAEKAEQKITNDFVFVLSVLFITIFSIFQTSNLKSYCSYYFLDSLTEKNNSTQFISNIVLGLATSFILVIITTAVFYKKAFTKKSLITFFGTAISIVAFFIVVEFCPSSYENAIPKPDDVEKVTISIENDEFSDSALLLKYSYGYYDNYETEDWCYTFKSSESIDKAVKYQEKCKDLFLSDKKGISSDYYYLFSDYSESVVFNYTLKDGSKVKRTYNYIDFYSCDEYYNLCVSKEYLSQQKIMNLNSNHILCADISVSDSIIDKEGTSELLKAVQQDYMNINVNAKMELTNDNCIIVNFYCYSDIATKKDIEKYLAMSGKEIINYTTTDDYYDNGQELQYYEKGKICTIRVALPCTCSNVIKYCQKYQLTEKKATSIKKDNVKKVNICYISKINDTSYYSNTQKYSINLDCFFIYDADEFVSTWNPASLTKLGYTLSDYYVSKDNQNTLDEFISSIDKDKDQYELFKENNEIGYFIEFEMKDNSRSKLYYVKDVPEQYRIYDLYVD